MQFVALKLAAVTENDFRGEVHLSRFLDWRHTGEYFKHMSTGHGKCLSRKDFHLIRISVLGATGKLRELRESLEIAIGEGICHGEITEALLATYLFAGYPRAINALRTLHNTIGDRDSDEEDCSS